VLLGGGGRSGIVVQRRARRGDPKRALGDARQLDHPLREQVHIAFDALVDIVEELVQGDEVRALHVPVRLLALGLQIDAVGQPQVEQLAGHQAEGLRQIVAGAAEAGGIACCRCHGFSLVRGWRGQTGSSPGMRLSA
jgi:hypothetical protein